jgi:hypothetical protein
LEPPTTGEGKVVRRRRAAGSRGRWAGARQDVDC